MWGWLGKSALSGAGVLVMFGAQVAPDAAELNLCKWVQLAWLGVPDHCLAWGVTGNQLSALGAVMALAGVVWFAWDFFRKRRNSHVSNNTGAGPNWPIRDLFFHIDPSILKSLYRDPETEVARTLLDYLATGRLHSWGRFTGSNGALVEIPADFWREAEWTMMFFDHGDEQQVHAQYPATTKGYRDIQFNRAEALLIWPKSIKTDWPDYIKWDAVDPLELYQAACLWADIEPALPWPSWGAEKVYRKINDHIHKSGEPFAVSSGETTREAIVEAIETQRSGLLNPRGKISRDDLKRIAKAWGEQPRFLYTRSRL